MAIQLSAADKRMIAEIEADAASKKTSKVKAKALIKEIRDAAAKRKTPKFNAQGQENKTPTKKPEAKKTEAKKPVAKALSAESKPSTNAKIRRKKVNTSRGKPPKKTKVDVRRTGGPKFGAGNKTATDKPPAKPTVKPKVKASSSTVGPAGDRISPQSKKVPSKLMNKVLSVGKNVVGGPVGALGAAATLYNMVHPDKVKERTGPSKAGFGTKKTTPKTTQAVTSTDVKKDTGKKDTGKKEATTASSFGTAFRKAKDDGLKVFPWNGKSYSTATKDEVKKSGSKNLREHLNRLNKKKSK